MCIQGVGRLRNNSILDRIRGNQFALTMVPLCKDFGRGGTAQDTGVNQPRETDMWDVSRRAENPFKVPDGLCAVERSVIV